MPQFEYHHNQVTTVCHLHKGTRYNRSFSSNLQNSSSWTLLHLSHFKIIWKCNNFHSQHIEIIKLSICHSIILVFQWIYHRDARWGLFNSFRICKAKISSAPETLRFVLWRRLLQEIAIYSSILSFCGNLVSHFVRPALSLIVLVNWNKYNTGHMHFTYGS